MEIMELKLHFKSQGAWHLPPPKTVLTVLVMTFLLSYGYGKAVANEKISPKKNEALLPVTGIVKDVNGEALPGVNVMVKGTSIGTVTDASGNYGLEVPNENSVLIFSFIGYATQEIKVNGQTKIDLTLREDIKALDEVVVVGYGTQSREKLVGSVAQISSEQIANRPVTQLRNALTGQLAGVTVTQRNGRPGTSSGAISIRGLGSFGANASALILVDGIPVDNFSDIDPNNVQTISVLKDASSAAIYGSRAANGVILVTTKTGKVGRPKISYNTYVGIETPTALPDYVNSWEYQEAYFKAENSSSTLTPEQQEIVDKYRAQNDPEFPNTDFLGNVLSRNGVQTSHNLKVTGGTKANTYNLSLGYLHQEGLVVKNDYSRFNVRLNMKTALSDKFDITTRLAAIASRVNEPHAPAGARGFGGSVTGIIQQAARLPGTFIGKYENGDYGTGIASSGTPISNIESESFVRQKDLNLNGSLRFDYRPIEDVKLSFISSYVQNTGRDTDFRASQRINSNIFLGPNQLTEYINNSQYYTLQWLADYSKQFGDHYLSILGGFSFEDYKREYFNAFRDDLPGNDLTVLNVGSPNNQQANGSGSENALESQFARVNYSYSGKYLVEGVVRRDGSSRFPTHQKYAIFPSVAAGWRIGQEAFIKDNVDWISELKLKASWGILGNQNISNYPYQNTLTSSLSKGAGTVYSFGGTIAPGVARTTLVDSTLHWESTRTKDIGLEVGVFKNKLQFSATYFDRYTYDILYRPTSSVSNVLGFGLSQQNTGELLNRGWEFTTDHKNALGKFSYSISGNFTILHNEVLDLGVGNVQQPNGMVGNGSDLFIGHPGSTGSYGLYYGYVAEGLFVDQEDVNNWADISAINGSPQPGDIRYKDISGPEGVPDGVVDATYDRAVLGSQIPKYSYGINLGAQYGGFDANILLQGIAGVTGRLTGYASWAFYHTTGNMQRWQYEGHWSEENPDRNAVYPRLEHVPGGGTPNTVLSSYWTLNGSYLRIKNIQLGYTLPKEFLQKIKISKARFYLSGENLHTFSKYTKGWDPEVNGNGNFYPILSTYTMGLNIIF